MTITYSQLKADMNEANLNEEFDPGNWPLDESMITWLVKYINGSQNDKIRQVITLATELYPDDTDKINLEIRNLLIEFGKIVIEKVK